MNSRNNFFMKEDGWYVGFIENRKQNEVVEIFEMGNEYAHSDIYYKFNTIDEAIKYYELIVRDLKGQKENNVKFIYDGKDLIKK